MQSTPYATEPHNGAIFRPPVSNEPAAKTLPAIYLINGRSVLRLVGIEEQRSHPAIRHRIGAAMQPAARGIQP